LDTTLLNSFPGYAFIKGFTDNLRRTEEMAGSFVPVAVQFDDYVQIAFETHREPSGKVSFICPEPRIHGPVLLCTYPARE
jgi:hypothetical protein